MYEFATSTRAPRGMSFTTPPASRGDRLLGAILSDTLYQYGTVRAPLHHDDLGWGLRPQSQYPSTPLTCRLAKRTHWIAHWSLRKQRSTREDPHHISHDSGGCSKGPQHLGSDFRGRAYKCATCGSRPSSDASGALVVVAHAALAGPPASGIGCSCGCKRGVGVALLEMASLVAPSEPSL